MKPQLKVLLYLKRNKQNTNNLCPLMGRITITGRRNSVAQFSTKLKVNPNLWNSTSQRQRYLSQDDLNKLMTTTMTTEKRGLVRDMFLFSVFTGVCYCDLQNLTNEHLKLDSEGNLWIETVRQKTGTPEKVLLLDIAKEIIGKYNGGERLFPKMTYRNMMKLLKNVAKECGITRNLTFHMARHTFASEICISNGVPIESVSKAMGHKDITTTQRYAKVTHEKIDRDMTMLNRKISKLYAQTI